jgi:Zn finger protein HypA/HybF involved in hydrogenase expression
MPKKTYDWRAIQLLYDAGAGLVECQRAFGFSHTAWVKALKRGSLRGTERAFRDRRRRYDWARVQQFYDEGHTYRECRGRFGFCAAAWSKAVARGELSARARAIPLERLLQTTTSRHTVKRRLLEAGRLENRCSQCGLNEWQGKPLSVQIDHINGIGTDHRLENLRMLCPNCHSQTSTFGGRNAGRQRSLQDQDGVM